MLSQNVHNLHMGVVSYHDYKHKPCYAWIRGYY
jgi:hypothetical protein